MQRKVRVLLVEDEADTRLVIAQALEFCEFECRAVGDAHAALSLVPEFFPDLALIDIGLPEIDGLELARLLRQENGALPFPLIAVSGYASHQVRVAAQRAGFHDFVLKPCSLETLVAAIRAQLPAARDDADDSH